ncbi:hypothetical protein OHB54_44570 [Streptomyces sp. NBC_01007]|nr:hypothetical protein OHB54_44570 [Streptomyces sp. NBC_01007]
MERDPKTQAAAAHLGQDSRITFVQDDADRWVARNRAGSLFDLAYVDCRPGKILRLADLLALLEPGGLYIVDDLLPQDTWPADHPERVNDFLAHLPDIPNLLATQLRWASGLIVGARL